MAATDATMDDEVTIAVAKSQDAAALTAANRASASPP